MAMMIAASQESPLMMTMGGSRERRTNRMVQVGLEPSIASAR